MVLDCTEGQSVRIFLVARASTSWGPNCLGVPSITSLRGLGPSGERNIEDPNKIPFLVPTQRRVKVVHKYEISPASQQNSFGLFCNFVHEYPRHCKDQRIKNRLGTCPSVNFRLSKSCKACLSMQICPCHCHHLCLGTFFWGLNFFTFSCVNFLIGNSGQINK